MSIHQNYRQSIVASIQIAGPQIADITSHGTNSHHDAGNYITATFGRQLVVTMLDVAGANTFVRAWTADETHWVLGQLPAVLTDPTEMVSTGPSLVIRAAGDAKIGVRYDSASNSAVIRTGALTWIVKDRAAADSMITTWEYVGHIAAAVLGTHRQIRRRTR